MRNLALLTVVVALLIGSVLLLRLGTGGSEARSPALETTHAPATQSNERVVELARTEPTEARVAASDGPVASPPAEIAPGAVLEDTTATPADREISGTIVLLDENGIEHRAEDGEFSLVLWRGDSGEWKKVDVHGGAWRSEIPHDPVVEALGVDGVVLGGRLAICKSVPERFPFPDDGRLELVARRPPTSRLVVRAREDGRDLAPVLLATSESGHRHPGSAAFAAKDLGPSPVDLPPAEDHLSGARVLHVRSPGYAWSNVQIDEERGGERIVLLDRSGDLTATIVGASSDPGAKLRVYDAERTVVAEWNARGRQAIEIDGLAAGQVRVAIEIGEWWRDPLLLAETEVSIVAGVHARVSLVPKVLGPRVDVAFEGTLVLADTWDMRTFRLDFELLDTVLGGGNGRFTIETTSMQTEGLPPGTWRWSAPKVQPGRYDVALEECGFHVVVEVPPEGLRDARIVVPAPCEVLVRCVDDETGEDVPDAQVTWYRIVFGLRGWRMLPADPVADARRWRFRAPAGEISISAGGPDQAQATVELSAFSATSEVTLRLARPLLLEVLLRDGTTEVPWSGDMVPQLIALDGQEDWQSYSQGGGRITLIRTTPGRYRLEVPEIPGFLPVAPIELLLEKGPKREQVIELVRMP